MYGRSVPTPTDRGAARAKRTTEPKAKAAPEIASPSVQLVRDGRVESLSPAVHVFLWGNPDTTERDLKLAKDAGLQLGQAALRVAQH